MYLRTEDVEKIGFQPLAIFKNRVHHFYYGEFLKYKKVFVIDNIDQTISHFALTSKEWKDYKAANLPQRRIAWLVLQQRHRSARLVARRWRGQDDGPRAVWRSQPGQGCAGSVLSQVQRWRCSRAA